MPRVRDYRTTFPFIVAEKCPEVSPDQYESSIIRHPSGETEGKHPRDVDVDLMRQLHPVAPLLKVIRAKCLDCSCYEEIGVRKCTAVGCPL